MANVLKEVTRYQSRSFEEGTIKTAFEITRSNECDAINIRTIFKKLVILLSQAFTVQEKIDKLFVDEVMALYKLNKNRKI